ncbi:MAG: M28 family peptidase [Vicinamibacteria bacterium]|nr:M28 family peptidase [Vicinamibacteria bacterium]
MRFRALPLLFAASLSATAQTQPPTGHTHAHGDASAQAELALRPGLMKGHVRFLASDLLEGRGPATRGDALAREYVAAQMERIGLEPGAPDGSWFQFLDVVGVKSAPPAQVPFATPRGPLAMASGQDVVLSAGRPRPRSELKDAELVFVGYGIVAPEHQWDDYKGMDLAGKVLVMLNNDPEHDPALFAGKTRLWYGRWDYKYEIAARRGAAGALIVHTTPSAGYGWQVIQTSFTGEEFSLARRDGGLGAEEVGVVRRSPQGTGAGFTPASEPDGLEVKGWLAEAAAQKLAQAGGHDLAALVAAAQKRDFKPVPLGVRLSVGFDNAVAAKRTANVIGKLAGSDPKLSAEAVVFTAHHDHLGVREGAAGEDHIHNGALDNAAGVATMLAIAEVHPLLRERPRRSVYFAAVAAEEQGLLGSKYLAAHLPLPAGRIAANVNIDGASIWGKTKDLILIGKGKSSLDPLVEKLAAERGRTVLADQAPDKGFFYRSDQFAFAKIGVPAVYFDAGLELLGQPAGEGRKRQDAFEAKHYHQPSDELTEAWDWSGVVEDARLLLRIGLAVANADAMPTWNPGDEFEAARKKALAEVPAQP